jgi:hypothetical protein
MDFGARNGGSSTTGKAVAVYTHDPRNRHRSFFALHEAASFASIVSSSLMAALCRKQNIIIISSSSTVKNSQFTLVHGHFKQRNLVRLSRCLFVELVDFMMLRSPIRATWLFRAFPCYFLNFSEGFVMSTQVKVQANLKFEFNGYFIRAGFTMILPLPRSIYEST